VVVERHRKALKMCIQIIALGRLHAEGRRALGPSADEDKQCLQQAEQERESAELEQA
jgi:hypothetical protein